MLKEGFNLVSLENAKKAIAYDNDIKGNKKNNELQEIYSVKDIYSVFAIETNYKSYYDVWQYRYNYFDLRVYDLNSGKVVMYAKFRGDRYPQHVLKKLVEKLSQQVK